MRKQEENLASTLTAFQHESVGSGTHMQSHSTELNNSGLGRIEEFNENPGPNGFRLEEGQLWISSNDNNKSVTRTAVPASPQIEGDITQLEAGQAISGPETEPLEKPSATVHYHVFSIHVLSLLMSFSVFGTLARLGIHALANYPGQSIFPLAWVQVVGCFIMGFTLALREPITNSYGPLYTAITTGFCGSLTTFSGWQLDVFQAWSSMFGQPKLWIYDVMDGLTRLLFTLALSIASLDLGVHLGKQLLSRLPAAPSSPTPFLRWTLTLVSLVLYVLTIPFFVRLNHSWRPLATTAIVFSFPGTFCRYVLSTQLNPRLRHFPLGTLLANELATMILVMCHIIQRAPSPPSPISCSILQGFIDGYCGCLSTVSTFASEVRTIRGKNAWQYIAVSLGVGQIICLVMLGPAWWTGRINDHVVCNAD